MALRAVGSGNYMRKMFYADSPGVTLNANTLVLMHFDGTNGSTTFTDVYGNVFSVASGTPTISTTQSKFGGASYFGTSTSNTHASISTPHNAAFDIGTGDFTIECWIFPTIIGSTGNSVNIFVSRQSSNMVLQLRLNLSGNLQAVLGNSVITVTGASVIATNTWTSVAITRASGTVRLFVGGTVDGSATGSTQPLTDAAIGLVIGASMVDSSSQYYGYVDELRISKTALYTANYTPATSAFTS